ASGHENWSNPCGLSVGKRQKIQLCSNCSEPDTCTTLRLAHRQKFRYNQHKAVELQLYLPMSSSRARKGSHRRWTRAAVLSPKICVLSSITMYALACLTTISSLASGGSSANVSVNQLKVTIIFSITSSGGRCPNNSSNHSHAGLPTPGMNLGNSDRHPLTGSPSRGRPS
ncbi:hypothetical protein PIB30_072558, partial [Stylosanthes scabra]|nr:hypothetical protein [Stylosanthes scabra]